MAIAAPTVSIRLRWGEDLNSICEDASLEFLGEIASVSGGGMTPEDLADVLVDLICVKQGKIRIKLSKKTS